MYKSILFIWLISISIGVSQTKTIDSVIPEKLETSKIVHYSRTDFMADPQFWTMCENEDGTLIFGNNDGALVFDGEHWKKVFLPNNSSIRSLVKTKNGKIYAGGYNEFGTLQKDKYGNYYYKSLLLDFHLENKNIENLWQVHQLNNLVIFRSFSELIVLNKNLATELPSNKSFLYSAKVNNDYFVQDSGYGIYVLNPNSMTLEPLFNDNCILKIDR